MLDTTKKMIEEIEHGATDEHGWKSGFSGDGVKAGNNHGYNLTRVEIIAEDASREMAVILVINIFKRKATHYPTIKKTRYLIGRNENGIAYAHPIPALPAMRKTSGAACIDAVCCWIWGIESQQLAGLRRCGDTAAVRVLAPPRGALRLPVKKIGIIDSHIIDHARDIMYTDRAVYIRGGYLIHTKHQHPAARVPTTWHQIVIGRREAEKVGAATRD